VGQKGNPIGFRVGVIKGWDSTWFAEGKEYTTFLHQDLKIRKLIEKEASRADISAVKIERPGPKKITIKIFAAKPGLIIGRAGKSVEALKVKIRKILGSKNVEVFVNIEEVKELEKDATLVAKNIAFQLERRASFRRAMKRAIQRARQKGVEGIKIRISGRIGGAEIARSEEYHEGRIPLHTLRADIDYGFAEANTVYGKIGVKVWINHGEKDPKVAMNEF